MKNAATCEHENLEPLNDLVTWCPDCGTRWASTREEIARVQELFMQKLSERHPDHPWLQLSFKK